MSATAAQDIDLDATGDFIYQHVEHDVYPGTSIIVRCDSGGSVAALVNVEGLHDVGEFDRIAKGASQTYRISGRGLRNVFVKGEGGTTTVDYAITEG